MKCKECGQEVIERNLFDKFNTALDITPQNLVNIAHSHYLATFDKATENGEST